MKTSSIHFTNRRPSLTLAVAFAAAATRNTPTTATTTTHTTDVTTGQRMMARGSNTT